MRADFSIFTEYGAALRISLNAYVFRAYSVDPVYNYQRQAKLACAQAAVDEGVIEFIKYGNGQTQPMKVIDMEDGTEESLPHAPPKGLTLQEFFDTLPRPFPDDVGNIPANDINAPVWINLQLQSARGARLVSNYIPVIDSLRHCKCITIFLNVDTELNKCMVASYAYKDPEKLALISLILSFSSARMQSLLFVFLLCRRGLVTTSEN